MCGSNNSSHFIYFKMVWMGVGVEQQLSFYLFKEGLNDQQEPFYLFTRVWIVVRV